MAKKRMTKTEDKEKCEEINLEELKKVKQEPMFNTIDFNNGVPSGVSPLSVGGLYFMLQASFGEDGFM